MPRGRHVRLALSLAAGLALAACSADTHSPDEIVRDGDLVSGTGTITYQPIEGGWYAIVAGNAGYDPMNLPGEFRQNGLRVRFQGRVRNDVVSFHMAGPILELTSIQRL